MSKPVVFDKNPAVSELEPGTYYWCSCGKSATQPMCDGAHKAEGVFKPVVFELTETKTVALCNCKQTKSPPWCDGTHAEL